MEELHHYEKNVFLIAVAPRIKSKKGKKYEACNKKILEILPYCEAYENKTDYLDELAAAFD